MGYNETKAKKIVSFIDEETAALNKLQKDRLSIVNSKYESSTEKMLLDNNTKMQNEHRENISFFTKLLRETVCFLDGNYSKYLAGNEDKSATEAIHGY